MKTQILKTFNFLLCQQKHILKMINKSLIKLYTTKNQKLY